MDWSRIKLLIIDMDNTLADTFHTLSKPQWKRVIVALKNKGWTTCAGKLEKNFGAQSFVKTLKECEFSDEETRFAVKEYDDVDLSSLALYPDAKDILSLSISKILITRGEPSLQTRKIAHLDIAQYFDEISIVDTFHTKDAAIKKILDSSGLKPDELLIIGDRVEEEISSGIKLGIPTALVKRPDWPVAQNPKPDVVMADLSQIANKLKRA